MRSNRTVLAFVLAAGTAFAAAQMQPGSPGMGQTPGSGYPGGVQQPGAQRPDMSRPGEDVGLPTSNPQDQQQQQKKQPKVDDSTLQRQIHDQLASNGELANVQVNVKDGVAHLDGSVPRKEDRKEAKKLAESVPGVRGVKEKLTVSSNAGSSASSTTGAENTGTMGASGTAGTASAGETANKPSAAAGETAAEQNPNNPQSPSTSNAGGVSGTASATGSSPSVSGSTAGNVGAQTGTATPQSGAVGSSSSGTQSTGTTGAMTGQSSTTGQAGTTTQGTGSIGNQSGMPATSGQSGTTMESGSTPATPDSSSDLGTQIQNALHNEPTLANDTVQVNATDNQIVLTGTVANGKERQTAKRIAESFAGNRKVVDHLTVSGHGSSSQMPQK